MQIKMLKEVTLISKKDKKDSGKHWMIQMILIIFKMFKKQLVIKNQIILKSQILKSNFNLIQRVMLLMSTPKPDQYERLTTFILS
jgi:hypothetical protein